MISFKGWLRTEAFETSTADAVEGWLKKLEATLLLLGHQTSDDVAMKIVKGREDFGHTGLVGTSDWCNSSQARAVVEKMNALHSGDIERYRSTGGTVHKGSSALLLMAVPKSLKLKNLHALDDRLIDLMSAGKIDKWALPNRHIVGFWRWDGKFFGSSTFSPSGIL